VKETDMVEIKFKNMMETSDINLSTIYISQKTLKLRESQKYVENSFIGIKCPCSSKKARM